MGLVQDYSMRLAHKTNLAQKELRIRARIAELRAELGIVDAIKMPVDFTPRLAGQATAKIDNREYLRACIQDGPQQSAVEHVTRLRSAWGVSKR